MATEDVGGGNVPALPGAADVRAPPPAPEETSSDDVAGDTAQDPDQKAIPNTPAEANPLRHLFTHVPKNDHCEACQRANMTKKHARRRHTPTGPNAG